MGVGDQVGDRARSADRRRNASSSIWTSRRAPRAQPSATSSPTPRDSRSRDEKVLAAPGTRRIYSNPGFDALGELVGERAGAPFEEALSAWVLGPLGMDRTTLVERPSQGLHGPIGDLAALATEFLRPTLVSAGTFTAATTVAFPGLVGVVPGVGRFDPCDWGLGFELHDGKTPHWMGEQNSPATFGHFGGSGSFLWVDPVVDLAVVALTDRDFGPWALDVWPAFSDAVLGAEAR